MLKKMIVALLLLIGSAVPVHAEMTDRFVSDYDFSKDKKIFVFLSLPEKWTNQDVRQEMKDVFYQRVKKELKDKLPADTYTVDSLYKAVKNMGEQTMTDSQLAALFSSAAEQDTTKEPRQKAVTEYLKTHYDMGVVVIPQAYEVQSKYVPGRIYTVPDTISYPVVDSNGRCRTITIVRNRIVEEPSGYYPAPYCKILLTAMATDRWQPVWERTEERMRIDRSGFSKPKSMFGRITDDFSVSLRKFLTGKKKPKSGSYFELSPASAGQEQQEVGF